RMGGELDAKFVCSVIEARCAVLEQIGESEVVVDSRKVRVERYGSFEFFDGFRQKTGFSIGPAEHYSQLRPVSKLSEHPIIDLFCRRELALLQVGPSKSVLYFKIGRSTSHSGLWPIKP